MWSERDARRRRGRLARGGARPRRLRRLAPDPPGTWERHVESVERFRRELGIETCVLVVHDWGGLIGLRWACEHPDAVRALVISSTGFFPDGKWHGMAKAMREPGTGEQLMDGDRPRRLRAVLRQSSTGMTDEALDEYWKALRRRRRAGAGQLELYRSGDFAKLERLRPRRARRAGSCSCGARTTSSRPWPAPTAFERELPDTELVVVDGARHFVWEDAPSRVRGGAHGLPRSGSRLALRNRADGAELFDTGGPGVGSGRPATCPASRSRRACGRGSLGEFVGQEHLLGRGSALRTAIEEGRPHSMILYGPPGTGKTTLARLLAVNARAAFEEASAVNAGRAEVRAVIERAQHRRHTSGERTIFFLDEIHRFNKAQQDTLLPAVEEGLVMLVGATTENPYFEVNSALLSRCRVYELRALEDEHVLALLRRALGRRARHPGRAARGRRRARVPRRALGRRRAHRAVRARAGLRDRRRRAEQ